MSSLIVDIDLSQKYNVPGPRYTSYPTAPHFRDDIPHETVMAEVARNNLEPRDLSLYFHIPFCQTLCWYCGCTTVIGKNTNRTQPYLEHLFKEMANKARHIHPDRKVVQMHFGGGTPTYLTPDEIRALGREIHRHFTFADGNESAVEIDPRRLTLDHVKALREAGFNRASIGVQDNNPIVQKAVNRIQPMHMTEQSVKWLRDTGFQSINIDLIYGLPFQTVETFQQTLDEVLTLNPDRFAIYSYAHVPWIKPSQKLLQSDALPSAEVKLAIHKMIIERLTSEGFIYIGMDHFARADNELTIAQQNGNLQRNFQGYSTWAGTDIYGFGMSAISQIGDAYIQSPKELDDYYNSVDAYDVPVHKSYLLTPDDRIRHTTIMRLMCDAVVDFDTMSKLLNIDFRTYFSRELNGLSDLIADGLILMDDNSITVTETGRLLLRNIAMRFDAYLTNPKGAFSSTI